MRTPGNPDRVLDTYYAEVRDSQLLTAAEEATLFERYRSCTRCPYRFAVDEAASKCPKCKASRDYKARDRLIEGALRFALKTAKAYAVAAKGHRHNNEVLQCLISAGNLGLLLAVDKFDLAHKTRFLTYAAWWVKKEIRDELDRMGIVRVPVYKQKDLRRKRKAGENTEEELGHIKVEDLGEVDTRQADEKLETDVINTYGLELLHQALQELGMRGRDKYIILAYYGLKDEPKTMKQIAGRLDLSMERIRQIKKKAMLRIKDHLDSKSIASSKDIFTE